MSCARGCCERQADHYRSVAPRMPSAAATSESKLSRDRDAYQRLRALGEQPRAVTGAAELERTASSSWEVENNFAFRNERFSRDWERASAGVEVTPLDAA